MSVSNCLSPGQLRASTTPSTVRALLHVLFCLMVTQSAKATDAPPLTLDDVFASPSLFGTAPSTPKWSPDSRRFAFTWNDEGLPDRGLWLSSADGKKLRTIPLPDTGSALRDFTWRADGQTLLILLGSELWQLPLGDTAPKRLGNLGSGASTLRIAPNDQQIAFLKEGDLWVFDLQDASLRALTDLGIPGLSNLSIGRYNRPEREIGPGIWGGPTFAWAPDSSRIAVHLVDRRTMSTVPFPDYLSEETTPNAIRRGYPGDPNESRQVAVVNVLSGDLKILPLEEPAARQIIDFSWSAQGVLLVDVASDTAEDRWLYRVEKDNQPIPLWHSNRPSRIYTAFASAWHPNGQEIVFLSDLDDRYGLYKINAFASDGAPERITDPSADVLSAPQITKSGHIFYTANTPSPAERQVFRIDVQSESPQQLTQIAGYNTAYPSPDGESLAFVHSEDTQPPEMYTLAAPGKKPHRVTHSPSERFSQQAWARSRYVSFPSHLDDYTLHARILEPPVLEPGKQYPVLFGPMYSNTVRNRWSGVYSRIQQLLVQKGYIVVQVDMRGSTGYGRDFREEFLVDFAGDDIEDIVSAVNYLKSQPHIDTARMGIWGSSYGGTLSVYTLLKKPGLFRAGVAAAAAVDPRFFGTDDVAIVRRPTTHPEIFLNTAASYAKNLQDHLLIIHGMQDQVVPFKTTAALADVLIREGKDFDFAFAPGATHSWSREAHYSRYLFNKMLQHFDRYLRP